LRVEHLPVFGLAAMATHLRHFLRARSRRIPQPSPQNPIRETRLKAR
jgi:hypothetical protein